ncbi:hypothetical protein MMC29_001510 [Sticta canariensis]|nr:hypothetical protein [Sticta canariensis]
MAKPSSSGSRIPFRTRDTPEKAREDMAQAQACPSGLHPPSARELAAEHALLPAVQAWPILHHNPDCPAETPSVPRHSGKGRKLPFFQGTCLRGKAAWQGWPLSTGEGAAQVQSEEARFDLARKLTEVESSQRYSFLEAMVGAMDAHLRFFQRSFEVPARLPSPGFHLP